MLEKFINLEANTWLMEIINKILKSYHDYLYFVFRVFVGLLFFQHGAQKLLGWFGGNIAVPYSLMFFAGLIETFGGLAIAFGVLTRLAALGSAIEMLFAYFMVHAPQGAIPIINKGELALLYFAAFLVIIYHGAKKWGLEKAVLDKEIF